jgi:hypothetical protein
MIKFLRGLGITSDVAYLRTPTALNSGSASTPVFTSAAGPFIAGAWPHHRVVWPDRGARRPGSRLDPVGAGAPERVHDRNLGRETQGA